MPTCDHCGGHVSDDWVRVFGVDGNVAACPSCKDRTMDPDADGLVTEYTQDRVPAQNKGETGARYDPNYATDGGED